VANDFEIKHGLKIPRTIVELVCDDGLKNRMPLKFNLADRPFGIEIQYFLDLSNQKFIDSENGLVRFAVTTDGFDLLVNVMSESLEVLQEEFGSIDSLGISFRELVSANKENI
jgi:hypothetical protein